MRANPTNHAPGLRLTLAALAAAVIGALPIATATGAGKGRTCFGEQPTKVGTQGSDVIHGTTHKDVIISLGGNDHITAGQGNDYICAGSGNDNVHGAEDFNRMNGGPGDDWLDGRRGPGNVAIGSKGDDLIQAEGKIDGSGGNDTIESFGYQNPSASPISDVTDGGSGRDRISGGSNGELLKGGGRNDKVFAGNGNDQLRGNRGNDKLHGEGGDDDINGGSGTDVCDQGPGAGDLVSCET